MLYKSKSFILFSPLALSLLRAQSLNINKLYAIGFQDPTFFYTSPAKASLTCKGTINKLFSVSQVGGGSSGGGRSYTPKEVISSQHIKKGTRSQLAQLVQRKKWLRVVFFTLMFLTMLLVGQQLPGGGIQLEAARKPLTYSLWSLSRLAHSCRALGGKTKSIYDAIVTVIRSSLRVGVGLATKQDIAGVSHKLPITNYGHSMLMNTLNRAAQAGVTAAQGVEVSSQYDLFKNALGKGYEVFNNVLPSGPANVLPSGPALSYVEVKLKVHTPTTIPAALQASTPVSLKTHASSAFLHTLSTPGAFPKAWTLGLGTGKATGFFGNLSGGFGMPLCLFLPKPPMPVRQKRKKLRNIFSGLAHELKGSGKELSKVSLLNEKKGHTILLRVTNTVSAAIRKAHKNMDSLTLKQTDDLVVQQLLELMRIACVRINPILESSRRLVLNYQPVDPALGQAYASLMQNSSKLVKELGVFVYAISGESILGYPGLTNQSPTPTTHGGSANSAKGRGAKGRGRAPRENANPSGGRRAIGIGNNIARANRRREEGEDGNGGEDRHVVSIQSSDSEASRKLRKTIYDLILFILQARSRFRLLPLNRSQVELNARLNAISSLQTGIEEMLARSENDFAHAEQQFGNEVVSSNEYLQYLFSLVLRLHNQLALVRIKGILEQRSEHAYTYYNGTYVLDPEQHRNLQILLDEQYRNLDVPQDICQIVHVSHVPARDFAPKEIEEPSAFTPPGGGPGVSGYGGSSCSHASVVPTTSIHDTNEQICRELRYMFRDVALHVDTMISLFTYDTEEEQDISELSNNLTLNLTLLVSYIENLRDNLEAHDFTSLEGPEAQRLATINEMNKVLLDELVKYRNLLENISYGSANPARLGGNIMHKIRTLLSDLQKYKGTLMGRQASLNPLSSANYNGTTATGVLDLVSPQICQLLEQENARTSLIKDLYLLLQPLREQQNIKASSLQNFILEVIQALQKLEAATNALEADTNAYTQDQNQVDSILSLSLLRTKSMLLDLMIQLAESASSASSRSSVSNEFLTTRYLQSVHSQCSVILEQHHGLFLKINTIMNSPYAPYHHPGDKANSELLDQLKMFNGVCDGLIYFVRLNRERCNDLTSLLRYDILGGRNTTILEGDKKTLGILLNRVQALNASLQQALEILNGISLEPLDLSSQNFNQLLTKRYNQIVVILDSLISLSLIDPPASMPTMQEDQDTPRP
jgi:hypothetical protein